MIDLNQELEDFDAYFFKRHGELPLDPTSEEYANKSYLKHEMFKAWKARAKAQAVPETHLLIPKEPNRKTIMAMACVCLGSVGSGPEFLTLKEAKDVYSALVEKESGAEG
ncbi:hypothetical protein MSC32_06800 [Acinetobacter baumannii]|uniref:hypothetical protein n=1 Tax=Acinetobacter baumannii TaxID=470 RepID=UPI0021BEDD0F|nr:hypothetical protein [Acinetobacter baumannii]EKV0013424.1 hypothetical protein [Acinetobacter baumannii]MCT9413306.1 hypothetical protein [Acinetobacter baumannii]MDC5210437.1 hypothetical protein [Acinetobacter baumannii]MDC5233493.1 hypothetical protein [Acinetobacter baumannii]MDC5466512.1 hypothetical protein [Acinetobacter baumannii]